MTSRRETLKRLGMAAAATAALPYLHCTGKSPVSSQIASQQYTWTTYFRREGRDWGADMAVSLGELAASGYAGFEPSFDSVEAVPVLGGQLAAKKIWTRSLYVNSVLHDPAQVEASAAAALEIARAAKALGVTIVVTNPSPIRWGSPENKSDAQLLTQARALDALGAKLRDLDMVLAYHNHDAEMREGAREFHHMMLGTDPANVRLCLDAHWVYRGAGNSQVALFDIVKLYAGRIVELHLRQSDQGIWSETFGPGDIDYARLAETLLSQNIRPHIVMEQAAEAGTPHTLGAIAAQRKSLEFAAELFADFAE